MSGIVIFVLGYTVVQIIGVIQDILRFFQSGIGGFLEVLFFVGGIGRDFQSLFVCVKYRGQGYRVGLWFTCFDYLLFLYRLCVEFCCFRGILRMYVAVKGEYGIRFLVIYAVFGVDLYTFICFVFCVYVYQNQYFFEF